MSTPMQDIGAAIASATSMNAIVLFDPNITTAVTGIRVFDVGQGDCIGLLDQNRQVFCYVDYGGVIDHPDNGAPQITPWRLPVSYGSGMVSIVLTHWDKDHYYSAYKKNPAAQNCDWLVPRQWAAPFAVRFAAKLSKARCWPETMARNPYRFSVGRDRIIEICKCESFDPNDPAQDRNTHGLAVMIINKKASAGVEVMILPGDCHFDGIPGPPPPGAIRALVAYHHGSHAGWTSQTGPRIANRAQVFDMAYSFSARNSYGHPDRTNYQPNWHANSVETPDLRANGAPYVDFTW